MGKRKRAVEELYQYRCGRCLERITEDESVGLDGEGPDHSCPRCFHKVYDGNSFRHTWTDTYTTNFLTDRGTTTDYYIWD